jgi:hypothetical protein
VREGCLADYFVGRGETPALGNDIPGYTREMLNVFPIAEWQTQKKDYILETWVEAALNGVE